MELADMDNEIESIDNQSEEVAVAAAAAAASIMMGLIGSSWVEGSGKQSTF